jgi:hypothetical protein
MQNNLMLLCTFLTVAIFTTNFQPPLSSQDQEEFLNPEQILLGLNIQHDVANV